MRLVSGYITMLLCVLCWSTSGFAIKLLDWHPLVISCIRSAIAALFMLIAHGRKMFSAQAWKAGFQSVFGVPVLGLAAVTSAATKMLYVTANKMTTPANAILLQHSAPVWAALFGWCIAGERPWRMQWYALLLTISGIILFLLDGIHYGRMSGDIVALLSGVTFALNMVFLRMQKEGSPALSLFLSHLIPVFTGIPFLFMNPPHWTAISTGAIIFLGLVQIGIASLLYAYAIKRIRVLDAMFIAQLEPVLNPVWVFLFSKEAPTHFALLGGALIIAAVLMAHILRPQNHAS